MSMKELDQIKSIVEFHISTEAYPVAVAIIDSMSEDGYSTCDILQIVNSMLRKLGAKTTEVKKVFPVIEVLDNSKDIPMKVANNYTWGNHDHRPDGNCPTCDYNLSGNASSLKYERCPSCHQKLDWH